MRTRILLLSSLALALAAGLAVSGCGGKKRPPAIAGAGSGLGAGNRVPSEAPRPVDEGPDVSALDNPAMGEADFPTSDPTTGEGGPLEDIHFEYDQATLSEQARAQLEQHALWLQNHRAARVVIEGHCDERGTVEYNLALGERRARATQDYLVSLGVAADRLKSVSYGKERPLDPASNAEAWARNRRAHFVVTR